MNKFYHSHMYLLTAVIMETHLLQQQDHRFLLGTTVLAHRSNSLLFFFSAKRVFFGVVFLVILKGLSRDSDLLWDSSSARQGYCMLSWGSSSIYL